MMMLAKRIKLLSLLKKAFEVFRKNDPLRMAGATAFFTSFALPAVLIILIQIFGLVLNPHFISRQLFHNLGEIIGRNTAKELHTTLFNVHNLFKSWYEATLGFLFLIFVATTLLKVIKDSLNQLWDIRVTGHAGIKVSLLNRAKSFIVIIIAGMLFLVVLLAEGGLDLIHQNSNISFSGTRVIGEMILKQLISFILVSYLVFCVVQISAGWQTFCKNGICRCLFYQFTFHRRETITQMVIIL